MNISGNPLKNGILSFLIELGQKSFGILDQSMDGSNPRKTFVKYEAKPKFSGATVQYNNWVPIKNSVSYSRPVTKAPKVVEKQPEKVFKWVDKVLENDRKSSFKPSPEPLPTIYRRPKVTTTTTTTESKLFCLHFLEF